MVEEKTKKEEEEARANRVTKCFQTLYVHPPRPTPARPGTPR